MARPSIFGDGTPWKPPFRFLDLPADLRTLVYEEVAYTTEIKHDKSIWDNESTSLLQTCELIQKEFGPVILKFAKIELPVRDWDFQPVIDAINSIQSRKMSAKALEVNDRVTVSIVAEMWEDAHMTRVKSWLDARLQEPAIDIKYKIWRRANGHRWKSKAEFMWTSGIEELRQLQDQTKSAESAKELAKIISALEHEAENVAKEAEDAKNTLKGQWVGSSQRHEYPAADWKKGGKRVSKSKRRIRVRK